MIHDGITIGGKHSYTDYDLEINARNIGIPEKKSIRKTVPFMSGYYDFSDIYGGIAWGERSISYTFDIVGDTIAEMDAERTAVVNWLCNVHDADIYDDSIPDYHFHGSYEGISIAEDGEHTELQITFVCYPFMIANSATVTSIQGTGSYNLTNDGQPVTIKATSVGGMTVQMGGVQKTIPAGSTGYDTGLVLPSGTSAITVSSGSGSLSFVKEVL